MIIKCVLIGDGAVGKSKDFFGIRFLIYFLTEFHMLLNWHVNFKYLNKGVKLRHRSRLHD